MAIHNSEKLRRPKYPELVNQRRENLKKILNHSVPEHIVIEFAENYLRSFKLSFSGIFYAIKLRYFPHWLYWLTDKEYRKACKEVGSEDLAKFEENMIELFRERRG